MRSRFDSVEVRAEGWQKIDDIKRLAETLAKAFDHVTGRQGALAQTHLEDAVMHAIRGIALDYEDK